jgi:hypothetical protein
MALILNEAKAFVSKFNFKTSSEYREYWKANTKPATLPVNPNSAYQGKGWISWSEFIGYNSRKKRKT